MTRRIVLALAAVFLTASALTYAVDRVTRPPATSWDDPTPSAEALAQAEAEGYAAAAEGLVSMCNSPYPAMTETCKGELRQKWIKGYTAWMRDQYRVVHGSDAAIPAPILPGHLAVDHNPVTIAAPGFPDGTLPVAP